MQNFTLIKKCFFVLFLITMGLVAYSPVNASHSAGADLMYKCLGPAGGGKLNYEFTLKFYRDCRGVSQPNVPKIRANGCGGSFDISLNQVSNRSLGPQCGSGAFCVQEYVYKGTNAISQCTDWRFTWEYCCRNAATTTINNTGSEQIHVFAEVDNSFGCNSSPQNFPDIPYIFACVGQQVCWNSQTSDPDGDVVQGVHFTYPRGQGEKKLSYKAGYSETQPIKGAINLTGKGMFCATPTQQEVGIITIVVDQYRGGKRVGRQIRDAQIQVLVCDNKEPSNNGIDYTNKFNRSICADNNFCFKTKGNDPDGTDKVTITASGLPPGATFVSNGANRPDATFCWKPKQGQVRNNPYCFTVKVKDNGCPIPAEKDYQYCITVTGGPNVSVADQTLACGSTTAQLCANVGTTNTNGWKFNWNNGGGTNRCANVGAGTYSVTVTNPSGCKNYATGKVNPSFGFNLNAAATTIKCDETTTLTANPSGAASFSYKWSTGATTRSITAGPGTYSVEVTSNTGCKQTKSITVDKDGPEAVIVPHGECTDDLWNADGRGSIVPAGHTITKRTWILSDGRVVNDGPKVLWHIWKKHGQQTVTLVIETDKGCVDTTSIPVQLKKAPVPDVTKTDAGCGTGTSLGSATANYSGWWGTVTYKWNTGDTAKTIDKLSAGKYWVTITGNNGCDATDTVVVEQGGLGGSLPQGDVTCSGADDGWAKARPVGGDGNYTFKWSDDKGNVIGTDSTINNLKGGKYNIYIEDGLGCHVQADFTIEEPDKLGGSLNRSHASCNGSTDGSVSPIITQGGSAPYNLSLYSGQKKSNVDAGDSSYFGGLKAGWDTLYVVDINGCDWAVSFEIEEPVDPVVAGASVLIDATCSGVDDAQAFASASGGTAPYSFEWNDAGQTKNDTIVNLGTGTHVVTVTDDAGCSATDSITIEPRGALNLAIDDSTAVSCDRMGGTNGSAKVVVNGGTPPYKYQWDDPQMQDSSVATGLPAGTYKVVVTDAAGCVNEATATIEKILQINYTIIQHPSCPSTCNDGIIEVSVGGRGVAPYTYRWNDPKEQKTAKAEGLATGKYTVTVFDDEGCFDTLQVTIGSVGVEDPFTEDGDLRIYPNPNSGIFNVELGDIHQLINISVYDMSGRFVYHKRNAIFSSGAFQVDMKGVENGMYFLELSTQQGRKVVKKLQVFNK